MHNAADDHKVTVSLSDFLRPASFLSLCCVTLRDLHFLCDPDYRQLLDLETLDLTSLEMTGCFSTTRPTFLQVLSLEIRVI